MKKKILMSTLVVFLVALMVYPVMAKGKGCTKIQDGVLTYSADHYLAGQPLMVGYDPYGYNYQAHMFNGYYANSYLGKDGFPPYTGDAVGYLVVNPEVAEKWYWQYRDVWLMMKWNDAWLSNKDCDGDGKLDRHYGYGSYIGSGAWLTNHQYGIDGEIKWNYFVKIVALDHPLVEYTYVTDEYDTHVFYESEEVGILIWGQFVVIERVYNEQGGPHGIEYLVQPAGFGAAG